MYDTKKSNNALFLKLPCQQVTVFGAVHNKGSNHGPPIAAMERPHGALLQSEIMGASARESGETSMCCPSFNLGERREIGTVSKKAQGCNPHRFGSWVWARSNNVGDKPRDCVSTSMVGFPEVGNPDIFFRDHLISQELNDRVNNDT